MDPTVVSFGDLIVNYVLPPLVGILMAVATVAASYVAKKFKVDRDGVMRGYLMEYVGKGVDRVEGMVADLAAKGKFDVEIKNAAISLGANFVLGIAPRAFKALNFTETQIRDLVEAELNKRLKLETPGDQLVQLADANATVPKGQ